MIIVFNKGMAMTIQQLERYMISEIENLHIRFESMFELLMSELQGKKELMTIRFDRIESRLDAHEQRLASIEDWKRSEEKV